VFFFFFFFYQPLLNINLSNEQHKFHMHNKLICSKCLWTSITTFLIIKVRHTYTICYQMRLDHHKKYGSGNSFSIRCVMRFLIVGLLLYVQIWNSLLLLLSYWYILSLHYATCSLILCITHYASTKRGVLSN